MICPIERKDKKINIVHKDKECETVDEFQAKIKNSADDIENIKNEFKKKHIDQKEFQKAIEKISLSQISRFYSILESRKFSIGSDYVAEFLKKQIERAENTNNEDLKNAKEFYEYYGKKILGIDFENTKNKKIIVYSEAEKRKREIEISLIKAYVRYCIGKKRLEGKGY